MTNREPCRFLRINEMPKLLVSFLLFFLIAPLAIGQSGVTNPSQQLDRSLPMTATDIEILDTVLDLNDAQRDLVNTLFRDFEQRFRREIRERELRINELVDDALLTQDGEKLFDAQQIWNDWKDERKQLETDFLDDLRLTLDESQIGLWPIVEREIRRKNEMPRGRMVGERVDMVRFVHELIPDWQNNKDIAAALREYAERIDPPLRRRTELLDSDLARTWSMYRMERTDECVELYHQILAQRKRIRDLNLATLSRLKALLPEDQGSDLEQIFIEREVEQAHPWGTVHQRIVAARNLPTLTADQRGQITPIIDSYLQRRPAMLRRIFDEIRAAEDSHLPNKLAQAVEGKGPQVIIGEGRDAFQATAVYEPEPIESLDDAYRARAELEISTWRTIRDLLTPEQRVSLPRPTDDIIWRRDIRDHGM